MPINIESHTREEAEETLPDAQPSMDMCITAFPLHAQDHCRRRAERWEEPEAVDHYKEPVLFSPSREVHTHEFETGYEICASSSEKSPQHGDGRWARRPTPT